MNEPHWISSERCAVLHEMLVLRYGGASGVRDPAVLEAVAARPKERFACGVLDLPALAACYAAGIARDRPFVSGNLASAFALTATFLGSNGLLLTGHQRAAVEVMMALAEGHQSEPHFAHYLRCNCEAALGS